MLRIIFFISLFLLTTIDIIQSYYYSSSIRLDKLIQMEVRMLENLEDYIHAEQTRHSNLRNFIGYVDQEMKKVRNNSVDYFGNPLNAWKAIKRATRDWREFYFAEIGRKNIEEMIKNKASLETRVRISNPILDDLLGAARGVARLQQTYKLKASDLANGTIMGYKVSTEMSATDCYDLGMSLINSKDTKHAETWLLEARGRLAQETQEATKRGYFNFPYLRDDMILDNLVPAVLQNGNTKLALWLLKEQLSRNPHHTSALQNYRLAEQQLKNERLALGREDEKKIEKPLTLRETYEKTCSGEVRQTPSEQRELRCRYSHNNVPFCLIAPLKVEELNLDPFIALYHEAIYDSEIEEIIEAAEDKIIRSNASDVIPKGRTSKSCRFSYHENVFLETIQQRLTYITGLSSKTTEQFQVDSYGIGGHYESQYDFVNKVDYSSEGNRMMTVLFYISDVELGGATTFPYVRLAVPPIKGSLLVWYNLHRSLEPDYRTINAGCPVVKGFKWSLTQWYSTIGQELVHPCTLINDKYKSAEYIGPTDIEK